MSEIPMTETAGPGTPNPQAGAQDQANANANAQDANAAGNTDTNNETIGATPGQTEGDGTLQRDPDQWATGDEPMTEAQKSYLDTLAKEAGEELPANLTKADASKHIDRLQQGNGRVQGQGN